MSSVRGCFITIRHIYPRDILGPNILCIFNQKTMTLVAETLQCNFNQVTLYKQLVIIRFMLMVVAPYNQLSDLLVRYDVNAPITSYARLADSMGVWVGLSDTVCATASFTGFCIIRWWVSIGEYSWFEARYSFGRVYNHCNVMLMVWQMGRKAQPDQTNDAKSLINVTRQWFWLMACRYFTMVPYDMLPCLADMCTIPSTRLHIPCALAFLYRACMFE